MNRQQSFIIDSDDLRRAKTEAARAGLSLNAYVRRALRAALDGKQPAPSAVPAAVLDPALIERLAALIERGEKSSATLFERLGDLTQVGRGLKNIADRLAPAGRPAAPASAPAPAARTSGLDEVRLSGGPR